VNKNSLMRSESFKGHDRRGEKLRYKTEVLVVNSTDQVASFNCYLPNFNGKPLRLIRTIKVGCHKFLR
jgi:hypothetical protein